MKVKELIHALSMANPESEVIAFDGSTYGDAEKGIDLQMTSTGEVLITSTGADAWDFRPIPPDFKRKELVVWVHPNHRHKVQGLETLIGYPRSIWWWPL